ncbi:unnamed protein product [Alopecurus aequalis]
MARPRAGAAPSVPVPFLLSILLLLGRRGAAGGGGGVRGSSVYPAAVVYPHHSRQISWHPRIFLYPHFLSDDEANHIVSLASGVLKKPGDANSTSGKSTLSEVRTSSGYLISKGKDPIVAGIEDKIAAWTFLPKDVAEGGETVFPLAKERMRLHDKHATLSECAQNGMAVKPRKGDALLFFNLRPDAATDPSSLHGGCAVIKGEKWSATKWIRVASFDKVYHAPGGNCTDGNDSCGRWAALGECTKNPAYMVGTGTSHGHCRRSCNVC